MELRNQHLFQFRLQLEYAVVYPVYKCIRKKSVNKTCQPQNSYVTGMLCEI
jgi:hypothetical protein